MHIGQILVFAAPLVATLAAQVDTAGNTPPDVIQQIVNLGVGGVLATIFFWCWREETKKREMSERRERQLLRLINNLPLESEEGDDTLPIRPAVRPPVKVE